MAYRFHQLIKLINRIAKFALILSHVKIAKLSASLNLVTLRYMVLNGALYCSVQSYIFYSENLCNSMHVHNLIGIFGIVWFVAWLILVFSTPADHPRISPEERHYIESSIESRIIKNSKVIYLPIIAC